MSHLTRTHLRRPGWLIPLLAVAGAAIAQTSERPNADSGSRLEEIIVTAQKREANIRDVPMAVTALSEQQLQVLNVKSFEDYARFVPGVSFIHRGETNRSFQPNIRGVQLGRASPTTAFYIDETPLQPLNFERIGFPDPDMFDVERVEILKGPQGTLYGAASMGGAIKVIPNAPNNQEYEARLQADFSRVTDGGPGYQLSGMVNVPLVEDQVAFRVAATIGHEDGYIRGVEAQTFVDLGFSVDPATVDPAPTSAVEALEAAAFGGYLNDTDFLSVRAALDWQVTDRFSITPSLFLWTNEEGHGRAISPGAFDASGGELLIFPIFDGVRGPFEQQSELYNIKANYDAQWGEVVASLTFFNTDWQRISPSAGLLLRNADVPLDVILQRNRDSVNTQDGREEQISFELRAATAFAGPFDFTGGLFYRDLTRDFLQFQPLPPDLAVFSGENILDNDLRHKTLEEIAVFGEVTWSISDSLEATAGLRWTDYERTNFNSLTGIFATPTTEGKVTEDLVNFSASLSYSANEDNTFYVRAAEGYRTGFVALADLPSACDQDLIDLGITLDGASNAVESDQILNYEAGWKTRLFNDRLAINASAYLIEWEDIQIDLRLPLCSFTLQQNAGQAEIQGFEIELEAVPIDSVKFTLSVGQADSELTEDQPAVGGSAGEPLPQVSEWTVAGAIDFYPPVLEQVDGYIRLDATYTDGSLYNFRTEDPRARDIKEEVFLTNLRFGFSAGDWDVSIYANNILDELERGQCRDSSFFIAGERVTCANVPRTVGLRVGKDFSF